jgi:peptidoglycan/LPS O-acetylase OafA/YrhL
MKTFRRLPLLFILVGIEYLLFFLLKGGSILHTEMPGAFIVAVSSAIISFLVLFRQFDILAKKKINGVSSRLLLFLITTCACTLGWKGIVNTDPSDYDSWMNAIMAGFITTFLGFCVSLMYALAPDATKELA